MSQGLYNHCTKRQRQRIAKELWIVLHAGCELCGRRLMDGDGTTVIKNVMLECLPYGEDRERHIFAWCEQCY